MTGQVRSIALLLLAATPALAGVAGTGTASVQVNFITQRLTVTATFADGVWDLPGVNLGSLAPLNASDVVLTNINVGTGASFLVPFANSGNAFKAIGDIACPAAGCATIPGTFAFVGFLDDVNVPLLPAKDLYTFDGSVDCTGNAVLGVNCSGPFGLNFFESAPVGTGALVEVAGSQSFFDSSIGAVRSFGTRVRLTDVTTPGVLDVAGFSRLRGAIPAGLSTSTDGFRALFFDLATGAIFTNAEVCVVVDADRDGIVDGTSTAVARLAGLHFEGNAFTLKDTRIDGIYACITVESFSAFALVAQPAPATTTTTTLAPAPTTTTTLPCQTAAACLAELQGRVSCPEGVAPKLAKFITSKVKAAGAKLAKAASTPAKAAKFGKQARAAIVAIDRKAASFAKKKKGGISTECRSSVGAAVSPVLGALDAGRL